MRLLARLTLIILAGCGGWTDGSGIQSHTLRVAFGEDEFPLAANRDRLGRYPLNAGICETLVRLTPDFTIIPWLAVRWEERGQDGVRFLLRRGITFSDGAQFDARAAAFALHEAARTHSDYSFLTTTSATVVNDSTLDVRPARLNLRLVDQLVHPTYGSIEPGSDPAAHPVCTGPFRVADYAAHDHLIVVRNARYWGPAAKLDTVVFRFIPDETTRVLALRAHEVDVIVDVGHSNAKALEHTPGVRIVTAPPGAVIVLYMNLHGAPPYDQLRDSALRYSIAAAVDRRTLVTGVLGTNSAAFVTTVNPPRVLGRYASLVRGRPYNPAGAARAIHGRKRSLTLIAQPGSIDRATIEYIQAQLAHVGIDVHAEQLDGAAFESRLNSGTFDIDLEMPNQNDANPAFLLALRWYSKSPTRSAAFTHASPRFDALVEKALAATTDDGARHAAAEAMHQLVDVEVDAVPLAGISRVYAMTDRVRGFVPHPSRLHQEWTSVWLAP
ncbi:MAG: ABC transporter substrate-binding protein [Gemmatimonadota bacterium]|nr:ABC transporter substrate-binding protein [Gemmatimonadota bacterium]